jgi:NAD(P)-dependent dehydrogenase (short-subunit alcohol dehydrogenase family)
MPRQTEPALKRVVLPKRPLDRVQAFACGEPLDRDATYDLFAPDIPSPTRELVAPTVSGPGAMPVPWIDSRHVSNLVLFLPSDEARFVTGSTYVVDAGVLARSRG